MNYNYIWDNNIVLDFLLDRYKVSPRIYDLFEEFLKFGKIYISSSQIHNIEYIFFKERKKIKSFKDCKIEWNEFLNEIYFIKTPSYFDRRNMLFNNDIEDYLIELSAKIINAKIITRDKEFMQNSDLAVSINDFFTLEKESKPKNINFLDLHSQYLSIHNEVDNGIDQIIKNTAFIGGKQVKQFEENFANYCQAKYCVGVGNGTDALTIALKSLDIGKDDEIITAANSFIATSEAITASGAKVVFVDCDPKWYTIDVSKIEEKITEKTKAIIPVHLYGQPADMDAISSLAKKYNLYVVEDAAQAHGASYYGSPVGTLGDVACFSFYPGKNLGAYGDGGAIVTNNEQLAKKCRMLANHGRLEKYTHEMEGYNSRLDGLQAAVLSVKLKYLDAWNQKRNSIAEYYLKNLIVSGVKLPRKMKNVQHVYHLFVVQAERRDELREFLKENGISTGIHYPVSLPHQKAYKYLGHKPGNFPVSEKLSETILSLPIYPELKKSQLDYIISKIKSFYE